MKKLNVFKNLVFINLLIVGFTLSAGETLNKEQTLKLFTNMTYDGHSLKSNRDYRVYDSADGVHTIHFKDGEKRVKYWRVNKKGYLCVSRKQGRKGKCKSIVSAGKGVYKKLNKRGMHRQTLSNFVSGNQLDK